MWELLHQKRCVQQEGPETRDARNWDAHAHCGKWPQPAAAADGVRASNLIKKDLSASKGRLSRRTRACAAETRRQPSMWGEHQTPESNAGLSAGAGVANQHSTAQHNTRFWACCQSAGTLTGWRVSKRPQSKGNATQHKARQRHTTASQTAGVKGAACTCISSVSTGFGFHPAACGGLGPLSSRSQPLPKTLTHVTASRARGAVPNEILDRSRQQKAALLPWS